MKRILLPLTLALAAGLAKVGALAAPEPAADINIVNVTRLGMSTTTFTCGYTLGMCHYLILSSLCQEKLVDGGVKERICRYTAPVPPFRLFPGEKKTVTNLPADFLYTMKVNAAPTPDEVLTSPMPH